VRERQQRFLAVSELALSSASLDEVVREALVLLQAAVEFDTGAFYWWDVRHKTLRQAVVLASEPEAAAALVAPAIPDDLFSQQEIVVPVLARGVLLGAFCIRRRGSAFAEQDFELVTDWVRLASVVIENARLLRQMRQSEKQYRSLFDACLDVIYMSTPGGLFLDINPAGATLFGHSSHEELLLVDIGSDLYEHASDREEFKRIMDEQGFVRDREMRLRRADG